MLFWDYNDNDNEPEEELAKEFLLYFSKINNIDIDSVPENNGGLQRK